MEIIGYGILLAIGFWLAPMVLSLIVVAIAAIISVVSAVLSAIFGGNR